MQLCGFIMIFQYQLMQLRGFQYDIDTGNVNFNTVSNNLVSSLIDIIVFIYKVKVGVSHLIQQPGSY